MRTRRRVIAFMNPGGHPRPTSSSARSRRRGSAGHGHVRRGVQRAAVREHPRDDDDDRGTDRPTCSSSSGSVNPTTSRLFLTFSRCRTGFRTTCTRRLQPIGCPDRDPAIDQAERRYDPGPGQRRTSRDGQQLPGRRRRQLHRLPRRRNLRSARRRCRPRRNREATSRRIAGGVAPGTQNRITRLP